MLSSKNLLAAIALNVIAIAVATAAPITYQGQLQRDGAGNNVDSHVVKTRGPCSRLIMSR